MNVIAWIACVALIGGCAVPLVIQERGSKLSGSGTATTGFGGGVIEVTLEQKVYRGRWQQQTGQTSTILTVPGATASPALVGQVSSGGNAYAVLRAEDGETLRCVIVVGRMAGVGTCEDSRGRVFDLIGG